MLKNELMEMNLQFFAEDGQSDTSDTQGADTDDKGKTATETQKTDKNQKANTDIEAELTALKLENAKLKKAKDKAMSETADYKKKLKGYLSEAEVQEQERAEEQAKILEELEALKKEKTLSNATNSFLSAGYDSDTAIKLAEAQVNNDSNFFELLKIANEDLKKAQKQDFIKNRPEPAHGTGNNNEPVDPFEEGFNSVL